MKRECLQLADTLFLLTNYMAIICFYRPLTAHNLLLGDTGAAFPR